MDNLKHLFEAYSTIGIKTDVYNMSLSGFIKFTVDAEIISQREFSNNSNIQSNYNSNVNIEDNKNNNISNNLNLINNRKEIMSKNKSERSLAIEDKGNKDRLGKSNKIRFNSIESENPDKLKSLENNNSLNDGNMNSFSIKNTNNNLNNNSEISNKNKIFKSDITVIFHYLCGLQNFDTSSKIKNHFDKNPGYNPNFENSQKGPMLDSKNILKADKNVKPLKMNFSLFLKSFELISNKLYKDLPPAQALELFFDINLNNLLKNKLEGNSLKKNYLDILNNMRREDIVIKINISRY